MGAWQGTVRPSDARRLIISVQQAVFSAVFYFSPIAIYQGWLMVGYATVYTMFPAFSFVLDRDISEDLALLYPELYKASGLSQVSIDSHRSLPRVVSSRTSPSSPFVGLARLKPADERSGCSSRSTKAVRSCSLASTCAYVLKPLD